MNRKENLKALQERYPVGQDTFGMEDYLEMLSRESLGRFIAVSAAGDYIYLTDYKTQKEAFSYLEAIHDDNIYSESPIGVADLDKGTFRRVSISMSRESEPIH